MAVNKSPPPPPRLPLLLRGESPFVPRIQDHWGGFNYSQTKAKAVLRHTGRGGPRKEASEQRAYEQHLLLFPPLLPQSPFLFMSATAAIDHKCTVSPEAPDTDNHTPSSASTPMSPSSLHLFCRSSKLMPTWPRTLTFIVHVSGHLHHAEAQVD